MIRSKMPEYEAYKCMKKRCYNKNSKDYYNYGGRGIKVCDEWLGEDGFIKFLSDLDYRPSSKHSLDRIDSNKDYFKENCKWSTINEQAINKRRNWMLFINEKWIDAVTASRILKIPYSSLVNGMRGVQNMPKGYESILFKRNENINY
jgi:hypothetical protein